MTEDTGGYSRTNVFRISDTVYALRDFTNDYKMDVANVLIEKLEGDEAVFDTTKAVFTGAFDTDDTKVWRFIPSTERGQMTTEMKSGSQ